MSVSVAVKNACEEVGDSPHWEEASQTLIYTDVWKGRILRWDPNKSCNEEIITTGKPVSFIVPSKTENRYVFNHGRKLVYVDLPPKPDKPVFGEKKAFSEPAKEIAEVEKDTRHRFCQGKCDSMGRLWAGTMGEEDNSLLDHLDSVARDAKQITSSKEADCSALYRMHHERLAEGEASVPIVEAYHEPVCISNGIAWNADNTNMFFVDSCARKITAFDFDQEKGKISGKKDIISLGKGTYQQYGFPSGITMDTAGKLWVCCYNVAKVVRFDLETGKEIANVTIPGAKRITSCCFGGKNLDEMYVTTSKRHVTELELLTNQSNAGSLFKITGLGVRGIPAYEYQSF